MQHLLVFKNLDEFNKAVELLKTNNLHATQTPNVFGTAWWSRDDVEQAWQDHGIEHPTDEQIDNLMNRCDNIDEPMIQAGWVELHNTIYEIEAEAQENEVKNS